LSASSSNRDIELHTAEIDWPEGSPSAYDIFSSDSSRFSAILEDPGGNGRDFLVSSAGKSRALSATGERDEFLEFWRSSHNFRPNDVPGVRQLFYAAYEAGGVIENLPEPKGDPNSPLLWVHDAEWSICIDNPSNRLFIATCRGPGHIDELKTFIRSVEHSGSIVSPVPVYGMKSGDADAYMDAVSRVKAYIAAGDIFQANIARFWQAKMSDGDTCSLYACLRHVNPAPFAGMLTMQFEGSPFHIISASPERLFSLSPDGVVETRPIAGTRRRGEGDDDDSLKSELLLSEKEKAEHIMLVDLERNDLGRVCVPGSVEVNERMAVEKYSTVQHIVSNVRGQLAEGMDVVDLFMAMFPGGTITGCPKVRCMEIIHQMEDQARGPYTGGIGYVGWDGSADMNILIRSFWHYQGELNWAAGAGIVADSDPRSELEETGHKAAGLVRALRMAK